MSAPKPGDRVKVTETYEGVWTNRPAPDPCMKGVVANVHGCGHDLGVMSTATVEVLASPVYVNSDTTEYRIGDVVRTESGGIWMRGVDPDRTAVWTPVCGMDSTEPPLGRLTLLVRDGRCVA